MDFLLTIKICVNIIVVNLIKLYITFMYKGE